MQCAANHELCYNCAAICCNRAIFSLRTFFMILGNTFTVHYKKFKKVGPQIWIFQNMLHLSRYAAHMQQHAAATALYHGGPYLHVILISNTPQLQSFMHFCQKKNTRYAMCCKLQIMLQLCSNMQQHGNFFIWNLF